MSKATGDPTRKFMTLTLETELYDSLEDIHKVIPHVSKPMIVRILLRGILPKVREDIEKERKIKLDGVEIIL